MDTEPVWLTPEHDFTTNHIKAQQQLAQSPMSHNYVNFPIWRYTNTDINYMQKYFTSTQGYGLPKQKVPFYQLVKAGGKTNCLVLLR